MKIIVDEVSRNVCKGADILTKRFGKVQLLDNAQTNEFILNNMM